MSEDRNINVARVFTIALVGDRCGKSAYLSRLYCKVFVSNHVRTIGLRREFIFFHTKNGDIICFNVVEYPSINVYQEGFPKHYYGEYDGLLVMQTDEDWSSCYHADVFETLMLPYIKKRNSDMNPLVFRIYNKIDLTDIKKKDLSSHYMSVKEGWNIHAPFLYLARKLVGDETLTFV